jgi:hypothetical protein
LKVAIVKFDDFPFLGVVCESSGICTLLVLDDFSHVVELGIPTMEW